MIWGHHLVVALGIGVASVLLTTILWRNTTHLRIDPYILVRILNILLLYFFL